jgi:ATP-dependent Zn protease
MMHKRLDIKKEKFDIFERKMVLISSKCQLADLVFGVVHFFFFLCFFFWFSIFFPLQQTDKGEYRTMFSFKKEEEKKSDWRENGK